MKAVFALLTVVLCLFTGTRVQAQTLNWGNLVGGPITTSTGGSISNSFVFQLGAFADGFMPEFSNVSSWLDKWRVFDQADYDPILGFSTATAVIQNGVTSMEPGASSMIFADLDAYIWVRNNDNPIEGSEWLLTRATAWKFPATGGDCCDTTVLSWSVSDLNSSTTPKIGGHNGVDGPGEFTPPGSTTGLQTHTFVPEPSSAFLTVFAGLALILRRRRETL